MTSGASEAIPLVHSADDSLPHAESLLTHRGVRVERPTPGGPSRAGAGGGGGGGGGQASAGSVEPAAASDAAALPAAAAAADHSDAPQHATAATPVAPVIRSSHVPHIAMAARLHQSSSLVDSEWRSALDAWAEHHSEDEDGDEAVMETSDTSSDRAANKLHLASLPATAHVRRPAAAAAAAEPNANPSEVDRLVAQWRREEEQMRRGDATDDACAVPDDDTPV